MVDVEKGVTYFSTKTYQHSVGLSCCFRQWKAESHCNLLHGYALEVKLTFEAQELNDRNWVMDFGSLKKIKGYLEANFDHKLLVAADDPLRASIEDLDDAGLAQVITVEAVGCEAFAERIYQGVNHILQLPNFSKGVRLAEVEVREHGGNSAGVRNKHRL